MSPRIRAIFMEPPQFEMGRVKILTSSRFEEYWKEERIVSKWYFLTKRMKRVYLKTGWNLFGRKTMNNIRIKETRMRACELTIYISETGAEPPTLHSIHGHILLNGVRMKKEAAILCHKTTVGIYIHRSNKVVVLKFFNDDAKEEGDADNEDDSSEDEDDAEKEEADAKKEDPVEKTAEQQAAAVETN